MIITKIGEMRTKMKAIPIITMLVVMAVFTSSCTVKGE